MKKKKAGELTTEGLAHRVFGTEAVREIKRQLTEKPAKVRKKPSTKAKGR